MANSSILSLPNITVPLSRRFWLTVLSYSGLKPSKILLAAWLSTPFVQKRSFIPSGIPHISGALPCDSRSSAFSACAKASSGVLCTKAPKGSAASISARQLLVNSTEDISFDRRRSRASEIVSLFNSPIILQPLEQHKTLLWTKARFSKRKPACLHP